MNEKIRELAEQAGDYVNEVYTPPVRSKIPGEIWEDGHVDWHTQFNQKFAELIVQETIDELLQQFWNYGVHGGNEVRNPTFHYAIKRTKEHFGVEE